MTIVALSDMMQLDSRYVGFDLVMHIFNVIETYIKIAVIVCSILSMLLYITNNFVHFTIHIKAELHRHFMTVLQSKKFYYVSKLMAMGLANGGSGYPYMGTTNVRVSMWCRHSRNLCH